MMLMTRNTRTRGLEAAIAHGNRSRGMDDKNGNLRYTFTYRGTVYLTDERLTLITSWRTAEAEQAHKKMQQDANQVRSYKSHTVLVVDHSGSMRKNDVSPHSSRTAAVYDSLVKDLLKPQLNATKLDDKENLYSLVEMSNTANIVFQREVLNKKLINQMEQRKKSRARSHGNYLPALEKILELLIPDFTSNTRILIMFLSDGAPSDHMGRECEHGIDPWRRDSNNRLISHHWCGSKTIACHCRSTVRNSIKDECVNAVKTIGILYGNDRVQMCTVAFGPTSEKFTVLKEMAEALPKHSFQKLGISSNNLKSAFSTMSSTLTSLRTDSTSDSSRIEVKVETMEKIDVVDVKNIDWDIYSRPNILAKERYSYTLNKWISDGNLDSRAVVLHAKKSFGHGVERNVFYFYEGRTMSGNISITSHPLVAKQSKYEESLFDEDFHTPHAKALAEVKHFSRLFNRRLAGILPTQYNVSCVDCFRYCLLDFNLNHQTGSVYVLVEPNLDGTFTKWNNNAGHVRAKKSEATLDRGVCGGGHGGYESEYSGEEEEDEDEYFGSYDVEDVPQVFSHYTYEASERKKLVCDIQGVWNKVDGYILTDPVVHTISNNRCHKMGRTDKGQTGIDCFFETHVCGPLCKKLGLETRRRQKNNDNCCSICLEPLGKFRKQGKRKLPCTHTFHKKCIDGWLNISNSCPLCRRDVF